MVLINISDHHLRKSLGVMGVAAASSSSASSSSSSPCVGMLFGVQSGLKVEIFTSFEAKMDGGQVDPAFVEEQAKLGASCVPRLPSASHSL
jgi:hypothetical protein